VIRNNLSLRNRFDAPYSIRRTVFPKLAYQKSGLVVPVSFRFSLARDSIQETAMRYFQSTSSHCMSFRVQLALKCRLGLHVAIYLVDGQARVRAVARESIDVKYRHLLLQGVAVNVIDFSIVSRLAPRVDPGHVAIQHENDVCR
jgi:hypothetical protein